MTPSTLAYPAERKTPTETAGYLLHLGLLACGTVQTSHGVTRKFSSSPSDVHSLTSPRHQSGWSSKEIRVSTHRSVIRAQSSLSTIARTTGQLLDYSPDTRQPANKCHTFLGRRHRFRHPSQLMSPVDGKIKYTILPRSS